MRSWKGSYRDQGLLTWAPKKPYYRMMDQRVAGLVSPETVLVAANPMSDNHLLGWACCSEGVAHYVWVRHQYRRIGIASRLLDAMLGPHRELTICSHWTKVCEAVQYRRQLRYEPTRGLNACTSRKPSPSSFMVVKSDEPAGGRGST